MRNTGSRPCTANCYDYSTGTGTGTDAGTGTGTGTGTSTGTGTGTSIHTCFDTTLCADGPEAPI